MRCIDGCSFDVVLAFLACPFGRNESMEFIFSDIKLNHVEVKHRHIKRIILYTHTFGSTCCAGAASSIVYVDSIIPYS